MDHERIEQAIDEVVAACGGRKRFATEMWPEKSQRDAHNLLDACLNPERREKFAPDQVLYLLRRGRAVGCDALMRFINRECGYEDPRAMTTQAELAALQREYLETVARQGDIRERIDHLSLPLRAAK